MRRLGMFVMLLSLMVITSLGASFSNAEAATRAEQAYVGNVQMLLKLTYNSFEDIQETTEAVQADATVLMNTYFVAQACGPFMLWQYAYEQIQRLDPPDSYEDAHNELLSGYELLNQAGAKYTLGFATLDVAAIEDGTAYLTESTPYFEGVLAEFDVEA